MSGHWESRDRVIRSEVAIEIEGKGVRRFEQEFYGVAHGLKRLEDSSENVQRAWRIYEREGKLSGYIGYLRRKYERVRRNGKTSAAERGREKRSYEGRKEVEEDSYYVLRSRLSFDLGYYKGKVYESWNRKLNKEGVTDKLSLARRYFKKPLKREYDFEVYELCRVVLKIDEVC